ncbi:MAG: hypothetical protein M3R17_07855 [Bacteroidota bacterium]|nr:hypothetical protein [Bacteroidota bacterium]
MIRYFFEDLFKRQNTDREEGHYRLFAIIDNQYFWNIEWQKNKLQQTITLPVFQAGFVSEEIMERCKSLSEVEPDKFKEQFGSIACFIERAVDGFKSYTMWISPDPLIKNIPWQISLN